MLTFKSKRANRNQRRGNPRLPLASPEEHTLASGKGKLIHVKGQIMPQRELKFIDVATANYAADTTGTVTLLNAIAEGDDFTNRNSRSVMVRSVAVRGFGFANTAVGAATLPQKGRVMLVWDNAPNGALALTTDIMVAANSNSFPNVNNEKRFTILWDKTFTVGPYNSVVATSVGYVDKAIQDLEGFVKLDAPVAFNGTAAAITSIQNGALLLVTLGSAAAGTTAASAQLSTRVRFVENDSI